MGDRKNYVKQPIVRTCQMPNHILLEEVRFQLNAGHTVTLRVRGNSMRPFLESGRDKVLLSPPRPLHVGDVALVLANDGRYILHRVVGVGADGSCTLWGDGNVRGREYATADNVIGVAIGFYRYEREKFCSCESKCWRWYSAFWMRTTPFVRRCLLFLHRQGMRFSNLLK